jgi:hypothetical protein
MDCGSSVGDQGEKPRRCLGGWTEIRDYIADTSSLILENFVQKTEFAQHFNFILISFLKN